MSQKRHIMHGRDHLPGGADPIGTNTDIDLRRYVLAAAPPLRNLWVGGHTVEPSGTGKKTTIACPLAGRLRPAPLDSKFYDHGVAPATGDVSSYANNVGMTVACTHTLVELTGVQFWRAGGAGPVTVRVWDAADGSVLATKTAVSGFGWNEVYLDSPVSLTDGDAYVVGWYVPVGGSWAVRTDRFLHANDPDTGEQLVSNNYPSVSSRTAFYPYTSAPTLMPGQGQSFDALVGPIVNYEPEPPFEIFIVATAREDTDEGVHILRTEEGEGVIDIYWSADADVAANVFVMAADPEDQGCEHVAVIGKCLETDEGEVDPPSLAEGPPP